MSATSQILKQIRRQSRFVFWIVFGGAALVVAIVAVTLMLNLDDEHIQTDYGRRSGTDAISVNGTSVLGNLFSDAGHTVRTKRHLSDAMLEQCEVIVWAPDHFEPPSKKVVQWFDQWFAHDGRTLIYIARDFDAGPGYYKKVIPFAPPEQQRELKRRQNEAHSNYVSERNSVTGVRDSKWFTLEMKPVQKIDVLSGPWSDGVDVSKTEIEIGARIKPKLYDSQFDYTTYLDINHFEWDEEQPFAAKKQKFKSLS
ncbi:MAG: hypothetical protein N2C12_05140, partial [Planctomycetales bacterium]